MQLCCLLVAGPLHALAPIELCRDHTPGTVIGGSRKAPDCFVRSGVFRSWQSQAPLPRIPNPLKAWWEIAPRGLIYDQFGCT